MEGTICQYARVCYGGNANPFIDSPLRCASNSGLVQVCNEIPFATTLYGSARFHATINGMAVQSRLAGKMLANETGSSHLTGLEFCLLVVKAGMASEVPRFSLVPLHTDRVGRIPPLDLGTVS